MKYIVRQVWLLPVIFLAACNLDSIELDKVKGPSLNNTFAINLGNIKYSVSELVESLEDDQLEVSEGSDLLLSFIYRDTTRFTDIADFIDINNVSNEVNFAPFDVDLPAIPTENVVTLPTELFEFEFNPEGGQRVDSTFFKEGMLTYMVTSDFGVRIAYSFTIDDVQDQDGNPVVFAGTLTETQRSSTQQISLEGFKNVASRVGDANVFTSSIDLTFTVPAGTAISAGDEINVSLVFENPEFSAVFGDFGTDPIDVQEDTTEIAVFDEFNEGGLFLNDPSIELEFENKFGVELGIDLQGVKSVDGNDVSIDLSGDVVDNLQFIDAPNNSQLGEEVTSSFTINKDNSNIDELLNSSPEQLVFSVAAVPNPAGSDNLNNYLFDSSYMEIRSTIAIPLDFRMDGFSRDFEIAVPGSDLEGADSLQLNVRVVNEIPFNGTLDLSFRNEDGEELYQLPDIGVIESPNIGSDGRTVEASESISAIKLDADGIDAFLKTTDIIATMNIFTFESELGTSVKIFSDYQLDIFLTAEGRVEVEL